MKLILLAVFIGFICGAAVEKKLKFGQEMVDHVNGLKSSYKARRYPQYLEERFKQHSDFIAKNQNKAEFKRSKREIAENDQIIGDEAIPESFDISEKWPQCEKVFKRLIDQGTCNAAGIVLPMTGMITDRRCIRSNGTETIPISAWDVLTCCEGGACTSGLDSCENYGSYAVLQQYLNLSGIVTGGAYETDKFKTHGCKPWPLDAITDYKTLNKTCDPTCRPEYTARSYNADKRKGRALIDFTLNSTTEAKGQQEIMNRGTVLLYIHVGIDFYQYSSGVYQNLDFTSSTSQTLLLRLHGWGVDSATGLKYWTAAFTYGRNWGEQGFVRILRGKYDPLNTIAIQAVRAYYD